MKYSRAMVTGGCGFIGSHLVDRLLAEGLQVVVLDDLSSGLEDNLNPKASFRLLDIRAGSLQKVFEEERPEVVFHLAAQSSVIRSTNDPMVDLEINIMGSLNVMEAARVLGVDRIIYSSTGGALYGEPQYLPCNEAHPIRPLAPYGASKYAVETYLSLYRHMFGLKNTILRYGNVYGPRQDPDGEAGVVAIFTKRMLGGQPVVIYGDGLQERDMVYVDDVVEANIKAMLKGPDETLNIGTGRPTNVGEIQKRLAHLTGCRALPNHKESRPGEVYKIYLDVSRARRYLSWKPEVPLEQGLIETVRFFSNKD